MCHSLCGARVGAAYGISDITDVRSLHRTYLPVVRSRLARNYRHPGFITAIERANHGSPRAASSHSVGVALYIPCRYAPGDGRPVAPVYTAHPFSHIHTSSSVKAGSAHETRES